MDENTESPMPSAETHGFMAQVDSAFEKQVLDIAQRQREPHIQHYRQADDLGRGVKVAERVGGLVHPPNLAPAPSADNLV